MQLEDIIINGGSNLFIERLMKENLWTKAYTLRVIDEYKKFLCLASCTEVSPSYQIDQVWHTHILFTKDYKKVCDEVIGGFLHHNPIEKSLTKTVGKDQYIKTKELYLKIFGYEPPADIWTNWRDSNYVYIDLKRHWVLPVGNWRGLIKILFKYITN
jgi:hypothetical protein